MRRLLVLVLLAVALPVVAPPVAAQPRPPVLEPLPDAPPPPPSLPLAPGQEPEVRIIQREREKVEEFRLQGRLYMIRVTPAGGVPYYLVDHFGEGQFTRADGPDSRVRVPMWVIHSW